MPCEEGASECDASTVGASASRNCDRDDLGGNLRRTTIENHGRRLTYPIPGQLFTGRYEIQGVIGEGGFSRVYLARQVELDRPVAIKVLKPDERKASDNAAVDQFDRVVSRFKQEAKLISRLKDQNTVVMYDYGTTDSGLLYLVMEYVDGLTLRNLAKGKPLGAERVVYLLRQVLSSLEEAHTFGVLHRDIKPANIMVYEHAGRRDQVKLLDFGIAKVLEKESKPVTKLDLTGDGILVGTPRYMSPEQIRGEELTPASDLYSLGLVVYELLVGTKAVESDSSISIISRHLDPDPISLPAELDTPDRLRQIVDRMLTKNPQYRYDTCTNLLRDLEEWDRDFDESMDDTVEAAQNSIEIEGLEEDASADSEEFVVQPDIRPAKAGGGIIITVLLLGGAWWVASSLGAPTDEGGSAKSPSLPRIEAKHTPPMAGEAREVRVDAEAISEGVLEASADVASALAGARSRIPADAPRTQSEAKKKTNPGTKKSNRRSARQDRAPQRNQSSKEGDKQTTGTSPAKDVEKGSVDDELGIFAIE